MKNCRKITFLFVFICFFIALSTSCSKKNKDEKIEVVIQQEWFEFSGFAGEVVAAKRFAKNNGIDMKIVSGSDLISPIHAVVNGKALIGVIGGDILVEAVAGRLEVPLVAIGVVNKKSPTCFLVLKDSDIYSPKDFVGKKVGILTGTNTERVYKAMMSKLGIDREKIHEINIPFSLNTFLLRKYDVRPAFIYDETVSLERQGIEYRIIDPTSYGVDFVGTVYFTRRDLLEKHRDLILNAAISLIQGWQYTIDNPDVAIRDLIEKYPKLDYSRELRSLELGIPYFEGENRKPLTSLRSTWESMIRSLEDIGVIAKGAGLIDRLWDPTIVAEAYERNK